MNITLKTAACPLSSMVDTSEIWGSNWSRDELYGLIGRGRQYFSYKLPDQQYYFCSKWINY
jgi:hypothetical protein